MQRRPSIAEIMRRMNSERLHAERKAAFIDNLLRYASSKTCKRCRAVLDLSGNAKLRRTLKKVGYDVRASASSGNYDAALMKLDNMSETKTLARISKRLTPAGILIVGHQKTPSSNPRKLESFLGKAGMKVIDTFGDYGFMPYTNKSEHLFVLAQKK